MPNLSLLCSSVSASVSISYFSFQQTYIYLVEFLFSWGVICLTSTTMWENESEARSRERMSSLEIERHDGLKNDAFVHRNQTWYKFCKL